MRAQEFKDALREGMAPVIEEAIAAGGKAKQAVIVAWLRSGPTDECHWNNVFADMIERGDCG